METRRLGKTGHESSVVALGAYAIGPVGQDDADRTIEFALEHGINHFDVAPSYADAELRLGDYLGRHPLPDVFIGCKTEKRGKAGAREELYRTLERLGRPTLDLYQLHAVCNDVDLEACFAADGSMEAILEARDEGLVGHIGITGHGWRSPATHLAALRRFDFATVMTSCNAFMFQNPEFRRDWEALTAHCQAQDVGIHVLKASAKTAWGSRNHEYGTWYEPLTAQGEVDQAVAWALSQPVTTLCSAGDLRLLPAICAAAERHQTIDAEAQATWVAEARMGDIFVGADAN